MFVTLHVHKLHVHVGLHLGGGGGGHSPPLGFIVKLKLIFRKLASPPLHLEKPTFAPPSSIFWMQPWHVCGVCV